MLTILNLLICIYIAARWILNALVWLCVYVLYVQIFFALCFTVIGIPIALALNAFYNEHVKVLLEKFFSLDIRNFWSFQFIQSQIELELFKDT